MNTKDDDRELDRPLWGAAAIAREANLYTQQTDAETGVVETVPDVRKAYYLLESGALARKRVVGTRPKKGNPKAREQKARGTWVSTRRLIRQSLLPVS